MSSKQQVAYGHMDLFATGPCHSAKGSAVPHVRASPDSRACLPVWWWGQQAPDSACQGPASAGPPGGAQSPPRPASWACGLSHSASNMTTCAGRPRPPKPRREHASREQGHPRSLSSLRAKSRSCAASSRAAVSCQVWLEHVAIGRSPRTARVCTGLHRPWLSGMLISSSQEDEDELASSCRCGVLGGDVALPAQPAGEHGTPTETTSDFYPVSSALRHAHEGGRRCHHRGCRSVSRQKETSKSGSRNVTVQTKTVKLGG